MTWIRGLLSALAAEGRTVFLSSHLLSELALVADHVVVLGRGRLIADAPLMTLTSDAGRTLEEASGRLIEAHVAGRTRAGGGPPLRTLLSPREYDVFLGIAQGLSNPEIAVRLTLALPTIKTHVNRILAKLDARDRVHLVILAYDHGIAPALPENPPGRGRTAAR